MTFDLLNWLLNDVY